MDTLKDFIVYTFIFYPNPSELSKARLVKMLYLADWKSALDYGHQITSIEWYFNHYGPYVDDVMNVIKADSKNFRVEIKNDYYGNSREAIYLMPTHDIPSVSDSVRFILNFIINLSYPLHWNKFIELVYSTYPMQQASRYSYLNLVESALKYKKTGMYGHVTAA